MTKQESIRQTVRLSTLHGWDKLTADGQEELRSQMERIFADEKTASAAVNSWINGNKWVPTPMDLHQLSAEFTEKPLPPTDRNCDECGGTGFRPCWELHTYLGGADRKNQPTKTVEKITFERWRELRKTVDDFKQRVCEAVEACGCNYGQFLAQARRAERLRQEADLHAKRNKSA
jgi:hypothetical protein